MFLPWQSKSWTSMRDMKTMTRCRMRLQRCMIWWKKRKFRTPREAKKFADSYKDDPVIYGDEQRSQPWGGLRILNAFWWRRWMNSGSFHGNSSMVLEIVDKMFRLFTYEWGKTRRWFQGIGLPQPILAPWWQCLTVRTWSGLWTCTNRWWITLIRLCSQQ